MEEKTLNIIDQLWEAAVERLPALTADEQKAGMGLLAELSRGESVTAARLAQALAVEETKAEKYLRDSGLSRLVHASEQGSALGFFGLSTVPTDHRFTVDGRELWTWCAADTLFLPELLDATAWVESKDPVTGQSINLTVSPTSVESAEPNGVVVSMNSPEAWETTSALKLIVTACHYIHFFGSPESGGKWTQGHPNTVLIPLDRAFVYVKRQNRRMFGTALADRE